MRSFLFHSLRFSTCVLIGGIGSQALAGGLTPAEEKHYLDAAKEAEKADNCVDAILYADTLIRNQGNFVSQGLYYKALCQAKLGDQVPAAENAAKIDRKQIGEKKLKELDSLLVHEPMPGAANAWSIGLSGGSLGYTDDETFKSGSYEDLVLTYATATTSFTLGYEAVADKQVSGANYTQSHVIGVVDQGFLDMFAFKLGARYQTASTPNIDKSYNGIFGLKWFHNSGWQVGVNYFMSVYSDYKPGKLSVSQVSPYLGKSFGSISDWGVLFGEAKFHIITPSLSSTTTSADITSPLLAGPPPPPGGGGGPPPPSTPTTAPTGGGTSTTATTTSPFKSSYSSFEVALHYYRPSFNLGVGFWSGEQVFGIQADGFVVYSSATLHKGGLKANFDYVFNPTFSLGVSYSSENLKGTYSLKSGQSTATGVNASFHF